MDPPNEVPCEIASGEGGETNSAVVVSQDELLAVDRSHCSSSLSYLTASFFKLLSCCVQFLHFSGKVTVDPCEVLPKSGKIASEEGDTSSAAISKNDCEVFSGKATVDPCDEVLPKSSKMAFEKGETSSAVIPKKVFSCKATVDPCEVLPTRHEIASEEGETISAAILKNDYEVFSHKATVDPCEVLPTRYEIASEEVETISAAILKNDYEVFSSKATMDPCEVLSPRHPPRHEIASEEGETSSAVISQNDFEVFSRKATMDPCEVLFPRHPPRHEIAFEEVETSSAVISKNDYEVFSQKATMHPCEVLPKSHEIAFEEGETSSSSISKNDYEVFLSFRGPDTRRGFADNLYHAMVDAGIRVFRDDDELAIGDRIADILTALNHSKICMVLLSPTFAVSSWCLREVERMVDRKKDIVPIFYDVTPDDVKLKTELYANALTMHENKYGKEQVQKWREALKEIPTIKGRSLKNTGYVEFSRKIAKEILTKLKVKNKYEIENFVQVQDEVEAALKLLDIGSGGCRFLAIHGMGGIGKTTLAKIIFNQIFDSFDCSCFLENIRENISQGGLQKLQEQLLRSIDPSVRDAAHIVDAIGKIKNNFTRKKVLIVLDDIDHKNHIRDLIGSFGGGSRIILTSRNTELPKQVTSIGSHLRMHAHFHSLEKKEMDSKQALKLFSRHAFGDDSPPKDFESLSVEAISTTGGLPLALEVVGSLVGSLLHRLHKEKVWRELIKKLKEAPPQDVQARLKISYDALNDEQQEIFLDIACFFIGEEKRKVVYMWEACELDPNYGIEVLISLSLIKLKRDEYTNKKCFWMHDQLRDLGRAIVKVNSKDARAGSRLWIQKDALDLLKRNEGKEKVVALHLSSGSLDRENFVRLEKLRYLLLTGSANLGGDFGGLIPNLRWLSLRNTSSFIMFNLCLREVVVLEVSWSSFYETWQGLGQNQILEQLKALTLSDCRLLTSMPDLSKLVNLEQLVLESCYNLTSIHSSIGKLQCLSLLIITNVSDRSIHLPESIGCLVSLTRLEIEGVGNLPNSIGKLVKLKHLSLGGSKHLRVLPDSIGDLKLLISLDLGDSGITELPSTIGRLAKLESLCLALCKNLQRLPDSIGNLHLLIDLNMYCSSIVQLPHSFGNLASLQKLDLSGSSITSLPDSFRGLEKLESLVIKLKDSIEEGNQMPNGLTGLDVEGGKKILNFASLFNLSHLEIVYEGAMGTLVLDGIGELIKLKRLVVAANSCISLSIECRPLQQLTSLELSCESVEFGQCLPSSLKSLNLDVKRWGQLPIILSSMKNLSKLKLSNFVIDKEDSFEGLESLECLNLNCCMLKFKDFPVLKSLRELVLSPDEVFDNELEGDEEEAEICPWLKNRSDLKLINFSMHEVKEGCESLVDLKMDHCTISEFANNVSVLKSLTSLSIECYYFPPRTCLHIPPQLNCLVELDILHCREVVYIQGFGKLKSLKKLRIERCHSLRKIGDLFELKGPVSIEIGRCSNFEGIDGVDRLRSTGTLSYLSISSCKCEHVEFGRHDGVDYYIGGDSE